MTHTAELIVLNTTKVGEKSLVIHCLCSCWGRRSFLTSVSRAAMTVLQPLSILEGEVSENTKSDLWRVRSLSVVHPLHGIRSNIAKNSMTMFMSEVLYRSIRDGADEPGLFDWLKKAILTLDALDDNYSNFHLRFLLEYAAALGFSPSMENLNPFAGEYKSHLERFLKSDFAESMLIPLSGELRNELSHILIEYISFHSDTRLNIRSLSVLREIFA